MSNDECKAMERPKVPQSNGFRVTESWRSVLRAKRLGATDGGKGARIKVYQFDSASLRAAYGRDPNTVTVSWDYALSASENYQAAVELYLQGAGWEGEWATATCDGGAVAVYVPGTSGGAL